MRRLDRHRIERGASAGTEKFLLFHHRGERDAAQSERATAEKLATREEAQIRMRGKVAHELFSRDGFVQVQQHAGNSGPRGELNDVGFRVWLGPHHGGRFFR